MKRIALSLMLLIACVTAANAQSSLYDVKTRPVRGFMPNMDQLSSPVDHIDPVSRKLHLEIPLASLPQGPGGSGFDLNLVYDTHLWNLEPDPIPTTSVPQAWQQQYTTAQPGYRLSRQQETRGGWAFNIDLIGLDIEQKIGDYPDCSASNLERRHRVRVRLMDGSTHTMQLKGFGKEMNDAYNGDGFMAPSPGGVYRCLANGTLSEQILATGVLSYYSDDASYLKLEIDASSSGTSWRLYFPDGRRIVSGQQGGLAIYDANGNAIHRGFGCLDEACNQLYRRIYDDAGHEIRITETGTEFSSEVITTVQTAGPDSNAPLKWTLNWVPMNIGITYERADPVLPWDNPYSFSTGLMSLKYVQLPLAAPVASTSTPEVRNSYAFGYADDSNDHGFGEVDSVRTPTGATFTYRYELENTYAMASKISHENKVITRKVTQPGTTDPLTWTYAGGGGGTTVTNPDTSMATYWWGPPHGSSSLSSGGGVYQIDEPNGRVTKRLWSTNPVYTTGTTQNAWGQNAWVSREAVTVGNSSGNPALTAVTDRMIDKNGNLIQAKEYDWVNYNASGIETGTTLKRVTDITYHAVVPVATNTSEDTEAYWNAHFSPLTAGQSRKLDAVARKEVSDGSGNKAAVSEFTYDEPFRRGNLTAEKKWDSVKSASVPGAGQLSASNSQVLTRAYDSFGNITDIYEPKNNPSQDIHTHITYESSGSYPTQVEYAYGTSEHRIWTYCWSPTCGNTSAGFLYSKTDADNSLPTVYGYDDFGRPTTVTEAGLRKTETIYDDANMKVTVKNDVASLNDGKLQSQTEYDLLGRATITRTRESISPEVWISTQTLYYPAANITVKSTPYRGSTPDGQTGWICTQTDSSKRVIVAATYKGSSSPANCAVATNQTGVATTVYDGDWTISTDLASKARKERRDALGRLLEVVEDPSGLNYSTTYSYDALNNLTQVNQGTLTPRNFQYSSLSRLKQAANPESGTINYLYYDSGELKSRTDARGVVTDFNYDALHRIKDKIYTDATSTPAMHYTYYVAGEGAPKIGLPKQAYSTVASSTNDSYDSLGRVTGSHHTIDGNPSTFYFSYSYFLNGAIQSVTNPSPSNRVVTYAIDDAGRNKTVSSGSTIYADLTASGSYSPDGRIAQMHLGNGLYESRTYDALVSADSVVRTTFNVGTSTSVGDKLKLEYNFSPTANNGNVLSQVITAPSHTWTQSYGYDNLNRLTSAGETSGWSQAFGYDRYGNQWISSSSIPGNGDSHELTQSTQFNSLNNRINNVGWYDAAGNQTLFDPFTLTYDAENRMIKARENDGHMSTYAYDGNGQRVKKAVTASGVTTTTYYLHNALGQLAAEYSTSAPTSGTTYIHTDMLGSTRLVTDASGAAVECYDYLPFGRMLTSDVNSRSGAGCYPGNLDFQASSNLSQKFTGKERDPETRLDFFGARYYSAAQGRWMTPDWSATPAAVPYANLSNPQSLNLYQYVGNNPVTIRDADGHCTALVFDCILEFGVVGSEGGPYGAIATGLIGAGVGLQMWSIAHGGTGGYSAHQMDRPFVNPGKHLAENTGGNAEQKRNAKPGNQSTPANPNGNFEPSDKHGPEKRGDVSAGPKNGQTALDNSVQVKDTSPRRVGVDRKNGEIVVLDQTSEGKYHGHIRTWKELTDPQRNALTKGGFTDRRGKILPED